jgi:hypothetical protein
MVKKLERDMSCRGSFHGQVMSGSRWIAGEEDHRRRRIQEESVEKLINCWNETKINCRKIKIKLGFIFLIDCNRIQG